MIVNFTPITYFHGGIYTEKQFILPRRKKRKKKTFQKWKGTCEIIIFINNKYGKKNLEIDKICAWSVLENCFRSFHCKPNNFTTYRTIQLYALKSTRCYLIKMVDFKFKPNWTRIKTYDLGASLYILRSVKLANVILYVSCMFI